MKSFTQHLMEFDWPQIYCDMDGVLADFTKFTSERLGQKFTDELWGELPTDLFLQLPPMPDAHKLWAYISTFDPFMLTAVPRESRGPIARRAAQDKVRWMQKHFGVSADRIYTLKRKNKKNFAKDGRDGRPNLLIDDHKGNTDEFVRAGGLAVLHTSASSTIRQLKKIGYP